MKKRIQIHESAVSPVVGVMMMLVVVIIIAAVVSGFTGGIIGSEKKAPQMTAETSIVNTGYYYGSQFTMVITGVSEPIPTKDLKIVTSWKASNGTRNSTTVLPNVANTNYGSYQFPSPFGGGEGIKFGMNNVKDPSQYWGNFTLTAGTVIRAYPAGLWGPTSPVSYGGYGPTTATYTYVLGTDFDPTTNIDFIQAVLGKDWNDLRPGDIVNVKLVHIPSGKAIYDQNVAVKGG
ncbi:MAG: type IV pilin [Methanoregulaceae archaeon]